MSQDIEREKNNNDCTEAIGGLGIAFTISLIFFIIGLGGCDVGVPTWAWGSVVLFICGVTILISCSVNNNENEKRRIK